MLDTLRAHIGKGKQNLLLSGINFFEYSGTG
jgi:hypothetical protein